MRKLWLSDLGSTINEQRSILNEPSWWTVAFQVPSLFQPILSIHIYRITFFCGKCGLNLKLICSQRRRRRRNSYGRVWLVMVEKHHSKLQRYNMRTSINLQRWWFLSCLASLPTRWFIFHVLVVGCDCGLTTKTDALECFFFLFKF